ncbi:hypothetical protein C0989_001179 [Termitomyces sp. Mn162]|nr:hypothetical protein C0989_001179 [Termitomyces sp. Mn162]
MGAPDVGEYTTEPGGPPLLARPAPAYWDPPRVKGTLSLQSPSPTPCPSALPPVALQPNPNPTLAPPQRKWHANSGLLKLTLLPSSGARRTLQGHVGPGNIKLSSHSLGPLPDTTQGWGDPSPNPPPQQTALASPLPVPPSNPLGQAGPPPDKGQTWSTWKGPRPQVAVSHPHQTMALKDLPRPRTTLRRANQYSGGCGTDRTHGYSTLPRPDGDLGDPLNPQRTTAGMTGMTT